MIGLPDTLRGVTRGLSDTPRGVHAPHIARWIRGLDAFPLGLRACLLKRHSRPQALSPADTSPRILRNLVRDRWRHAIEVS